VSDILSSEDWKAAQKEADAFEKKTAVKLGAKPAKAEPAPVAEEAPAEEPAAEETETPADEPEEEAKAESFGDEEPEDDDEAPKKKPADAFVKERIKLREERRTQRKALEQERAKAIEELTLRERTLSDKYGKFEQAARALEIGDVDGFAKNHGFKDWNDLATKALETVSSPGYRRLQQLERERDEQRARDAKELETRRSHEEQERVASANARWRQELTTDLKKSSDVLVAEFCDEPAFIDAVMAEQQKEWDGSEAIPAEEAAERVLEAFAQVHARMDSRFAKNREHAALKKFLSRRQAENDETRSQERDNPEPPLRAREKHGNPKPKPSHSRTSEAGRSRDLTDAEWRSQTMAEMRASRS